MNTSDPAVEKPFEFDLKQRNTMKVSGLAAYVQRPPRDRVGWVHVEEMWLPDWRPKKWVWRVQHIEITFDSYCAVEELEAQQLDFEPWDYFIVTSCEEFLTDDIGEVETFFSRFVDQAEFARHPKSVGFPDEFRAHERQADGNPIRWSLIQRGWLGLLLRLKNSDRSVIWQQLETRFEGQITEVRRFDFELTTEQDVKWLLASEYRGVQLYTRHEDGCIENLWHEPTPSEALDPSTLPIWNHALNQWVLPEETEASE